MDELSRAHAEALDAADPLGRLRERFVIDAADRLYLDGNSLGRLPVATRERLRRVTDDWGADLVGGWSEWIELPERAGDALAEHVLGARSGEVIVADSVTVNLFKLVRALVDRAGDSSRRVLATESESFPTDRYVLEGVAAQLGLELRVFPCDPVDGPTIADLARALAPGDVVLAVVSHVAYRSGALADLPAMTAAARDAGVPLIWDLCHSAGALPVELEAAGADYAVGCTYKYLNAGPGAPAFLYVRREHQQELRSPIWGWFGQRDQFAMERSYDPEPGIRRFLAGTPPVLPLAAVEEGARLIGEAGIAALRAKSAAQTQLMVALHDAWLAPLGFRLGSPRSPERRGSHVAVRHDDGWRICRALIEQAGVIPDFRAPDAIRLATAPLYTRFVDVWDALDRLRRLVERRGHERMPAERARVT